MKANLKNSKTTKKNYAWLIPPTVAVLTTIAVSSCTKNSPDKAHTISESDIQLEVNQGRADIASGDVDKGNAELKSAADKYARMGELLMMPDGFQYADEMFGKALEIDPSNRKANFYKAITEPAMLGKGFIPKIERLLTEEHDIRGLEKLRRDIEKYQMPELTQFANQLPANEKAFISYYDVQRFSREKVLPALKTAVARLNKIDLSISPLQLNILPDRFKPDPVRQESRYSFETHYCDNSSGSWQCQDLAYAGQYGDKKYPSVYFIDKHDLKLVQSAYMAMIASVQVATAYSNKDMEFALRRLKALDKIRSGDAIGHLTTEDVTRLLREFPDLLTLEKDNELADVAANATSALKNAISLDEIKNEVCNNPRRTAKNAAFIGICLTTAEVDTLKLGVDLLAGPKEIVLGQDKRNRDVRILVDVTRLLKNPVADLKSLLPISFDENGEPDNYPDPTMGGVFPNGDIIGKLKKVIESGGSSFNHGLEDLGRRISNAQGRF